MEELPDEILHGIFLYLHIVDLARLQCVCRRLCALARHPTLWRGLSHRMRNYATPKGIAARRKAWHDRNALRASSASASTPATRSPESSSSSPSSTSSSVAAEASPPTEELEEEAELWKVLPEQLTKLVPRRSLDLLRLGRQTTWPNRSAICCVPDTSVFSTLVQAWFNVCTPDRVLILSDRADLSEWSIMAALCEALSSRNVPCSILGLAAVTEDVIGCGSVIVAPFSVTRNAALGSILKKGIYVMAVSSYEQYDLIHDAKTVEYHLFRSPIFLFFDSFVRSCAQRDLPVYHMISSAMSRGPVVLEIVDLHCKRHQLWMDNLFRLHPEFCEGETLMAARIGGTMAMQTFVLREGRGSEPAQLVWVRLKDA